MRLFHHPKSDKTSKKCWLVKEKKYQVILCPFWPKFRVCLPFFHSTFFGPSPLHNKAGTGWVETVALRFCNKRADVHPPGNWQTWYSRFNLKPIPSHPHNVQTCLFGILDFQHVLVKILRIFQLSNMTTARSPHVPRCLQVRQGRHSGGTSVAIVWHAKALLGAPVVT